jgi:hypothetical protein
LIGRNGAGRPLTRTDVDLIFAKIKKKGSRRIDFNTFLEGCYQIAATKNMDFIELVQQVLASGGAGTNNATKTRAVSLHDDTSTYTGVYARGGPVTQDGRQTLENMADRSAADIRGLKIGNDPKTNGLPKAGARSVRYSNTAAVNDTVTPASRYQASAGAYSSPMRQAQQIATQKVARGSSSAQRQGAASGAASRRSRPSSAAGGAGSPASRAQNSSQAGQGGGVQSDQEAVLREMFASFCSVGGGRAVGMELDGPKFVKMCKQYNVIDRKFTSTDADIIFAGVLAKAQDRGKRRISYDEFLSQAIPEIARRKRLPEQSVIDAIVTQAGYDGARPRFNTGTTTAEANRFHDDHSLYTGVYARGGPTNTNDGYSLSLDSLADRSAADVRGTKR